MTKRKYVEEEERLSASPKRSKTHHQPIGSGETHASRSPNLSPSSLANPGRREKRKRTLDLQSNTSEETEAKRARRCPESESPEASSRSESSEPSSPRTWPDAEEKEEEGPTEWELFCRRSHAHAYQDDYKPEEEEEDPPGASSSSESSEPLSSRPWPRREEKEEEEEEEPPEASSRPEFQETSLRPELQEASSRSGSPEASLRSVFSEASSRSESPEASLRSGSPEANLRSIFSEVSSRSESPEASSRSESSEPLSPRTWPDAEEREEEPPNEWQLFCMRSHAHAYQDDDEGYNDTSADHQTPLLSPAPSDIGSTAQNDEREIRTVSSIRTRQSTPGPSRLSPHRRFRKRNAIPPQRNPQQPSGEGKKKGKKNKPQEEALSPAVETFLRSKRSSRRDSKCKLWQLGNDGVACRVTSVR